MVDLSRYISACRRHADQNREFAQRFPDFALPPLWLCFDAYNHVDLFHYRESGQRHAFQLAQLIQKHRPNEAVAVLDWGCGPGRVARHLEELLPTGSAVTGADTNPQTIRWCQQNLPAMNFQTTKLAPPLPWKSEQFDVVFGLSVYTHLRAERLAAWRDELLRMLRPGGLLVFTTHGQSYAEMLADSETRSFTGRGTAVRKFAPEGKKLFATYHHPRTVMETHAGQADLLEHRPAGLDRQDLWIWQKPQQHRILVRAA
jgi:SAM-dependent methyltransferase